MYQQPPGVNHSSDSLRRLSSNNPFRQYIAPQHSNPSSGSIRTSNAAFEEWVEKNKKFIDEESDEEISGENIVNFYGAPSPMTEEFARPQFPTRIQRTGSDSSVSYSPVERKMSSNNPFASAMNDSYVHHRDPPPPPTSQPPQNLSQSRPRTKTPPSRPPKVAPPSYEEAAGPEAKTEYPREKTSTTTSSSSSSSRPERERGERTEDRPRRTRSESDRKDRSGGSRSHHKSSHHSSSHRERSDRDRDRERRLLKKSPSKKTPQPVKSKNLDTIDKLDVTGFFGGGFHHDGPFDACTPHRNKNVKAAPVMAFPADGPNNSMQSYAKDKHLHIDLAFGNYEDDNEIVGKKGSVPLIKTNHVNNDPTTSLYLPKHNPSVINFDANQKAVPIHGQVTPGLGSSTFVDGAPAPKAAVADEYNSTGGLGRKKSIVQRLRKNSGGENPTRRTSHDNTNNSHSNGTHNNIHNDSNSYSNHLNNNTNNDENDDDPIYHDEKEVESTGNSLLRRVKSLKVGRK